MQYVSRLRPFAAAAFLASCAIVLAQVAPPTNHWELTAVRSGIFANPNPVEGPVWREFVTMPVGTPWLRLYFSRIWLAKGSYLRIVSLLDGDVQTLHMEHVEQWQSSSAYFNGNSVMIELIAGPGTLKNFVEIDKVMVGDHVTNQGQPDTICGGTDDRVPSNSPAAGRIDSGCSGWIINSPATGTDRLHLSAGHCFGGGVLEFDVPASLANCGLVHPPATKQFAIDSGTSMFVNGGIGNDYWVYRCFANSTTGLTTFQTQAAAFTLATSIPGVGATLRNYGYGVDGTNTNGAPAATSCTCSGGTGQRNQTQQTHAGPLSSFGGTTVTYSIDTCGGNSGSVVVNDGTGQAVAIHTNGGCTTGGGSNSGTAVTNPNLQAAIQAMSGGTGGTVPNDDCATASSVVDGINGPYSNVGALNSTALPCGNATTGRDIWFRYVATCSGSTTFDTCSPTRNFDTVLEVLSGTCGALASLACNDDSCTLGSSATVSLAAGQTYFVRVAGYGGAQGSCDLTITSCNASDECAGAVPLHLGANGPFGNGAATNSAPAFTCVASAGKDLWFTYVAPPAANVTFTTCNGGTNFDTVIEAFSGSCGSLVWRGCNDDDFTCSNTLRSRLSVNTTGPTTLFVRVGGYGSTVGTFVLDVTQSPTNDECATAVAVVNGINGPFSNLNATTSFVWPCALGGSDVWFSYTATCTGMLLVDTCSAARTYDTALEVFSGTCGGLVSLGCNDDACGLGSSLSVPVTLGQNCWIRLGGFFAGQGQAELAIACIVSGDECATATTIADGVNGPFTTVGSTTSAPAWGCGFNTSWDVWFNYTAPATVPVTFWTCTPTRTFDTVMEVFSGGCGALVSIGCNDDFCSLGSRVSINATQGTTYRVRVGGFNGAFGSFDVEVQPGTGLGSIVRNVHGCGPTSIAATGQPRIGGSITTTLGNLSGIPLIGLGQTPLAVPFCGCTVGHDWLVSVVANSFVLNVPLSASLIGAVVATQGVDFLGSGGCPSPQLTLTDTMVITIG
ncbi:MAG: hypothetical protein ABIP94_19505 [Planctomycetota bacterium]